MKAKPILFNGEMVRAILDGRKMQTRRVIKPQPEYVDEGPCSFLMPGEYALWHDEHYPNGHKAKCPYGEPGGLLWVRETWAACKNHAAKKPSELLSAIFGKPTVWYRADGAVINHPQVSLPIRGKWRPSIHMPRWASRLTLRALRVWVERVQDITHDDALAEGCPDFEHGGYEIDLADIEPYSYAKRNFARLWDSINAKRGFGWEVNPWVWCVEFEVAE